MIQNSSIFRTFVHRSNTYSDYYQTSTECASGLFDLDFCHREGFNTCFPRVNQQHGVVSC